MSQANGIIPGMSRATYERIEGVNWSSLKHLGRSPAHYRAQLLAPWEDTDARKLGRAVHLAALEPELFRTGCALWTGARRAGKEWEAFRLAHAGQELLREEEHKQCLAIQRAVRSDATAAKYLARGRAEVSLFWTHVVPSFGGLDGFSIDCKGRVDFLAEVPAIVDLKTTRDASPEGFARECWRYQYHAQAAFYSDGHRALTGKALPYVIVAVESAAPHAVTVFRLPEAALELGREAYKGLLQRLHLCRTTSHWPGYADAELELELPRWATATATDEDATGLGLDFHPAAEGAAP